jgi:type VI protein secretion system component Hcp
VSFDYSLQLDGISGSGGGPGNNVIPIESFSFGASNAAAVGSGGPQGAGKVSLSELSLMMMVSAASPELLLACEQGSSIKSGVLAAAETPTSGSAVSLRLMLSGVRVTSVQFSGASGGGLPQQSISLSFQQIRVVWGSGGSQTTTGWDLMTNTAI